MSIQREKYISQLISKSWNGKVKIITGIRRGYQVDVGVVTHERLIDGKRQQIQYEVDFVVNKGFERIYIQSALNVDTPEKKEQETFSLKHINEGFQKLVIVDGNQPKWVDNDGVQYIGVIPFLLTD